jgi:apolipoprotein N-acyltransferase
MIRRLVERIQALTGWRRATIALLAGACAGFAMPPFHAWPVLFLAFPIYIWLIDGLAAASKRAVFATGWFFGLGYFVVSLHWIGFAFLVDAKTYLWMMPFMVGGLAGGMAIYWGLAAAIMQQLWAPGLSRILVFASVMAIAEWLRGILLTGFPWAAIGLAAEGMGVAAQLASIFGMTGLTFLICLWGGLPALLDNQSKSSRQSAVALGLLALLPAGWLWGAARVSSSAETFVPNVKLRIVQPDIPQSDKWRANNEAAIFNTLVEITKGTDDLKGISHVIWPESAVPFLIDESAAALSRLDQMLPDNTVLIMGALRRERDADGKVHVYNSVQGFDGFANLVVQYDKWRLVPGGEFLPFEWILAPLGFRKVVTVPGSFAAGAGPVTLPVPGAPPAGFLICYEAIFPQRLVDPDDRPQWLINVTNDGWFGNSSGPYQHLAQARLRAIEQGLPIVRAANTGISAVIDPYGRILERLQINQAGVIDERLPATAAVTLYARFGDSILAILSVLGLLPAALLNFGSRLRRRSFTAGA